MQALELLQTHGEGGRLHLKGEDLLEVFRAACVH